MEVWNNVRLLKQLQSLQDSKRTSLDELVVYVLNPFISSLGYDIYDLNQVDIAIQSGRVTVKPIQDISIIFSVANVPPQRKGNIFVYIDTRKYEMQISLNVLGKWELSDSVDLTGLPEEIGSIYAGIIRMISNESFQILYSERKERLFTERLLRSKLQAQEFQNPFLVNAIQTLLDEPSDALLLCLAEILADKYSTDTVNDLHMQLQPLKGKGLRSLVVAYLQDVPMTNDTLQDELSEPLEDKKPYPLLAKSKSDVGKDDILQGEAVPIESLEVHPQQENSELEGIIPLADLDVEELQKEESVKELTGEVVEGKAEEVVFIKKTSNRSINDAFSKIQTPERKAPLSKALPSE